MNPTASPRHPALLQQLRGSLVVSCQARPGEPLYGPEFMAAMARSAVLGGAGAIRVNEPQDITAVRQAVDVPVIGLWKDGEEGVYITPTLAHALTVAEAGADIVALDATIRPRRDRRTLAQTIGAIHDAGALVMADIATLEEGLAAAAAGADMISTTLSGYTPQSPRQSGPDLGLVAELAEATDTPVFAEGRYSTPAQAAQALLLGAHAVVVGGAITRPTDITSHFAAALGSSRLPREAAQ
ncbi:N-acetylmannosamine-6-phosphate 2-epimerase [Streptomyces sp. NPDC006460]|uniref:N-acetylmannosamine-6-phosphate 2-epimerase n=1 Tax=Streptomyces sp. NPDC006460 TaxID=3154304 RepID=UPI0033BD8CCD